MKTHTPTLLAAGCTAALSLLALAGCADRTAEMTRTLTQAGYADPRPVAWRNVRQDNADGCDGYGREFAATKAGKPAAPVVCGSRIEER